MSGDWIMLLSLIGGIDLGLIIVAVWQTVTVPPIADHERLPTMISTTPPTTVELNAGALG